MLLLAASTGTAYPPAFSFGRSEAITLSDGRIGQMRTLHAEGIARGSFRVVLTGPDGRVLARSRDSRPMSIICGNGTCIGYDHHRFQALEPDSTSFIVDGPIVGSKISHGEASSLFYQRSEEVGFRRRTAYPFEVLRAEYGHARDHAGALFTLTVLAVAALAATALRRVLSHWSSRRSRRLLVRGVAVALEAIAYAPLVVMIVLANPLEGLSWPAIVVAVIGGFLLAELSRVAVKAARRA